MPIINISWKINYWILHNLYHYIKCFETFFHRMTGVLILLTFPSVNHMLTLVLLITNIGTKLFLILTLFFASFLRKEFSYFIFIFCKWASITCTNTVGVILKPPPSVNLSLFSAIVSKLTALSDSPLSLLLTNCPFPLALQSLHSIPVVCFCVLQQISHSLFLQHFCVYAHSVF